MLKEKCFHRSCGIDYSISEIILFGVLMLRTNS